jgi:hypothetical protein
MEFNYLSATHVISRAGIDFCCLFYPFSIDVGEVYCPAIFWQFTIIIYGVSIVKRREKKTLSVANRAKRNK